MANIVDGKLIDVQVEQRIQATIERGALNDIHAIVVHQTGGATAQSTFESYKGDANGAHFLIDKDGSIYQTARVTRQTYHVGKIKSRCLETHLCTPEEKKDAKDILFAPKKSYSTRTNELAQFEAKKDYPARYPTNADSIGIELVGGTTEGKYESPPPAQNESLKWLIGELEAALKLGEQDVYRHPQVSYKETTEAGGAKW